MSLQNVALPIYSLKASSLPQQISEDSESFASGRQTTSYHPDDVEALLSGHPELQEAVMSAVSALSDSFPEGDCYRLAVTREQEMPSDRYLVLEILTGLDPEVAMECMAAFDHDWLLGKPGVIAHRLIVDIAPR